MPFLRIYAYLYHVSSHGRYQESHDYFRDIDLNVDCPRVSGSGRPRPNTGSNNREAWTGVAEIISQGKKKWTGSNILAGFEDPFNISPRSLTITDITVHISTGSNSSPNPPILARTSTLSSVSLSELKYKPSQREVNEL